ncbi:hypothetical protein F7725_005114 [Dissostichus mawsoni]|uniref:HECT domain-containing protein n=1 Tax=Dissostichus mawsoni TaxID=36200 RepID=A0A7J5YST9_DISMA|nr:hypothetical protein F7725_005114 [Dissostichus mawsoni]
MDTISGRVDVEKRFKIQISRTNILERGLLQWQRQKGSSPTATLNVTFFGEAGVDTGALRKEFLTDVLLSFQVESATEHSIIGLSDEILNCGYTGNVSIPNKDTICHHTPRSAVAAAYVGTTKGRLAAVWAPFTNEYPDICQPLFVSGEDIKVNAEFVMTSILPQLTEDHGHADKDGLHPITPATFLQWITGQGHVPLLPSEKKDFAVVIQFNHDCSADFGPHSVCYPVVTACAKTITLPVRHMRPYEKLKNILTEAFQLGQ